MLRVALIGAGGISNAHSNVYTKLDQAKIIAVVDMKKEAAEGMAALHGAKAYTTIEELFGSEKPDMVDICTPTFTHSELAIKALNRKVHVLCEKPMSTDLKSAGEMLEAANENGVFLMIAQVLRFWPEYMYLKRINQEGTYGHLIEAYFKRIGQSPGYNTWFTDRNKSGLSPLDLHIHDIDFLIYLLGMPKAITSFGIPDDEKNNYIVTHYLYNGVTVEAEGGWFEAPVPFDMSYRAIFEKAAIYFDGNKLTVYPVGGQPFKIEAENGLLQETEINISSTDAYFNEIKYFSDCIINHIYPSISSMESSLECLEIALKEIESARTGRTIIL